jgi:NAD-dependent DNA ligase
MRVVFTGTAVDGRGEIVTRDRLAALATKAGYTVEKQMSNGTKLLVASRHDTQKARKAQERGIHVTDYVSFIDEVSAKAAWC